MSVLSDLIQARRIANFLLDAHRRTATPSTAKYSAFGACWRRLMASLAGQGRCLVSGVTGRGRARPRKGGGPRKVARARPALGSPSDPEVAQEPVGVLQCCRAGNRIAGGARPRLGRGAGRVPVQ